VDVLPARQDGLEIKEVWVHPVRDEKIRCPRLAPDWKRPVRGVHQSGEVRIRLAVLEEHADRQELVRSFMQYLDLEREDLSVKRVLAGDVELVLVRRELCASELHVPEVEDVGLVREINSVPVVHQLCYRYVRQVRILVVVEPEDALRLPCDIDVLDNVDRGLLIPSAGGTVRQRRPIITVLLVVPAVD